jgi:hypothetical protein
MRLLALFALWAAIFWVRPASATPIKPDLKKLLQEGERQRMEFGPARAGWDADAHRLSQPETNVELEMLGPEATARGARASLIAAATPDWRAVILLFVVILLLRNLHHRSAIEKAAKATELAVDPSYGSSELPRAA